MDFGVLRLLLSTVTVIRCISCAWYRPKFGNFFSSRKTSFRYGMKFVAKDDLSITIGGSY